MKSTRIIIATALLILLSSFFSGCTLVTENEETLVETEVTETSVYTNIEEAIKIEKDVIMNFSSTRDGDMVTVSITLDNPNGKEITSVEGWLSYDPDALEGDEITIVDSSFEFTAPYDNSFDEINGLVMIGRANTEPITVKTINVAEVVFKVNTEETTMVDIYDYQNDMSGHTSANMLLDGTPYNVLLQPESPALIITN